MFGWEFSLIIATIRIINCGLLDELPDLKIHFSHFSGGIGRYRGRYNGFQQRTKWGTSQIARHNRQPKLAVDHYLNNRLYYDCAGWAGPDPCGPLGADWVKFGLQELALSQCVFATDYPQAIRDPGEVKAYVDAVERLDPNANALVHGLNAEKLVPDIKARIAKRKMLLRSDVNDGDRHTVIAGLDRATGDEAPRPQHHGCGSSPGMTAQSFPMHPSLSMHSRLWISGFAASRRPGMTRGNSRSRHQTGPRRHSGRRAGRPDAGAVLGFLWRALGGLQH
jgi:hypothetical protein